MTKMEDHCPPLYIQLGVAQIQAPELRSVVPGWRQPEQDRPERH